MKTRLLLFVMSHGIRASLMAQGTPAALPPGDSAVADRVAGCYELLSGGWQSDSELAKIATLPRDPVRFELTKNRARGWDELSASEHVVYFEVRMDSIAQWGRGLFTAWKRLSDAESTIIVSRPLPMAGFALSLTLRKTDLVGTITAFTDAVPPDGKFEATRAVTAHRVPCPLPHR